MVFLHKCRDWAVEPSPRVFLFKSGGGAAARLVDRYTKPDYLWPGRTANFAVFETLMNALRNGDIVDVEEAWRGSIAMLPESIPFQPYAAMAQWLLDTLSSDR